MWYAPYLRVRRAVFIYALLVAGVSLAAIALRYWPGVVTLSARQSADLSGLGVSIDMLLSAAAAFVGGLATVLGLNLAAENDGHLELAWTKPVSREAYALGIFAVDITAIAVCIALTVAFAVLVIDIDAGHQAITFVDPLALLRAIAYCGFPLCVYAWITALSASLKGNRGAVAGFFWPAMAAIALLTVVPIASVHAVASALNLFNPIALFSSSSSRPEVAPATYLWGWGVAALLLAAALAQWRRLEI